MVMKMEGEEGSTHPYYMEGYLNVVNSKQRLFRSRVTKLALDEIKEIMRRKDLQVRKWLEDEKYIDFNRILLNLLTTCIYELQVRESYIRKARNLIAKSGKNQLWAASGCHCWDIKSSRRQKNVS